MAGRYKPYPEYKDSGVDWIGKIPCDWDMWKITHACPYVASGTTPKADGDVYYGGENLWVTTGELREGVIFDTLKKVTDKALLDMPTLRLHPRGSVSIAMYGATIGRLGIFGKEAATNQACCVMPPSATIQNKYLFYWLYATRQEIINLSSGGGQPNVNQEKIASLKVSCPNYNLQTTIANFLDHETAKIDTLIEKQQQLIELLKEKRQAVISHAVTKGLSSLNGGPNAKLRDSSVEWLGEVPEGWVVGRYKFCTDRIVVGIAEAATHAYADSGVPIIRSTNIKEEGLDTAGMLFITEEFAEKNSSKYLYANDVITVRTGYPGISAVIPKSLHQSQCFTNLVATPNNSMLPEFLAEYLNSHTGKSYFDLLGWGSAQKNISVPILQNIPIAYPVKDEQFKIIEFIRKARWKFSVLIDKAEKQVALLQERRTALISAAVTGKIDVRDWVAPPASPTTRK